MDVFFNYNTPNFHQSQILYRKVFFKEIWRKISLKNT
jgi:hypothetical protein